VVTSDRESANFTADIDILEVVMPEVVSVASGGILSSMKVRLPVLKPRGDIIGKPNVTLSRDMLPGELSKKKTRAGAGDDDIRDIMQYVGGTPCSMSAAASSKKPSEDPDATQGKADVKDKALKHLLK
jgi:hypothetical protein